MVFLTQWISYFRNDNHGTHTCRHCRDITIDAQKGYRQTLIKYTSKTKLIKAVQACAFLRLTLAKSTPAMHDPKYDGTFELSAMLILEEVPVGEMNLRGLRCTWLLRDEVVSSEPAVDRFFTICTDHCKLTRATLPAACLMM
jgi:hypothetical protein